MTKGKPLFAAVALAVSAAGLGTIKYHEGTVQQVYLDPVNIATVCTGHTGTVTKADLGKRYSLQVCDQLLKQDVFFAEQSVKHLVKAPVTQDQYDALVSFTFNLGPQRLKGSTLLRKHNAGDCYGAAKEFSKWVYAGGKVLPGLVKRRADERTLYESSCVYQQAASVVPLRQR